jgi:chorismate synthase
LYYLLLKGDTKMAGSSFGTIFRITTWGESHGKALGVVVDGVPAGLALSEADIQAFLDRRKPGQTDIATPRKEADEVEILSGIFEGRTTGTPISMLIRNTSQKSTDYSEIASYYRPGHADYTFDAKYGFRDYRGGGRSSGRETVGRVAGGAIASLILKSMGIDVFAYTTAIGPISIAPERFERANILTLPTAMPDAIANELALAHLKEARVHHDSVGGIMECKITGLPAGLGDTVFEKLDANLAKAIMSIGAVKAVEIGDGVQVSSEWGSVNNDAFCIENDSIVKATNHAGGILGGMSDGDEVIIRAYVKPTPSIFSSQHTVNKSMEEIDIQITGRHDPIIVPRAVVVMDCMAAATILDALLLNMTARLDKIQDFYKTSK